MLLLNLQSNAVIVITPIKALLSCIAMTVAFVATLYLLPVSIRSRPRDDPVHIKARILCVATACSAALRFFTGEVDLVTTLHATARWSL
jgi:hypothetical protein